MSLGRGIYETLEWDCRAHYNRARGLKLDVDIWKKKVSFWFHNLTFPYYNFFVVSHLLVCNWCLHSSATSTHSSFNYWSLTTITIIWTSTRKLSNILPVMHTFCITRRMLQTRHASTPKLCSLPYLSYSFRQVRWFFSPEGPGPSF